MATLPDFRIDAELASRHWARSVDVEHTVLMLGINVGVPALHWGSGIDVGLVSSLAGSSRRRQVRHVDIGVTVLRLGLPYRRAACHVVVGLAASSLGLARRRWGFRIIIRFAALSLG